MGSAPSTPAVRTRAGWPDAWRDPRFRIRLVLTVPALALVLAILAGFLDRTEGRPGVALPDPVLSLLPPRDLTWLIFGLIYLGLFFGVARLGAEPRCLVVALQAYVVLVLFRIAAMGVTPLEAPPGMIPLHDPVVRLFGPGKLLTKDLFFSGHTSTLFLLFLAVPGRRSKIVFLVCTAAVGISVLWQHVHYTIDVLVAPLFSYASFRLAVLLDPAASR
jgi:PAP2 superfamily C-terminal